MSNYQGDDAEYMEDVDDEMDEDDLDEDFRGDDMAASDSDVDEFDYSNNKIADTSADQARKGKDIQGIPWDRLSITRETYRQTRLEQYKNYENVPNSGESSGKVSLPFSMSRRFSFSSICFTNIGFQLILIICLMNSGLHGHTERGSFL